MKKKMKNYDIALLTFKNLIMVLKNKKLYPLFRCTIGRDSNKSVSYLSWLDLSSNGWYGVQKILDSKNPFLYTSNYKQIIELMIEMCRHTSDEFMQEDSKIQMLVTQHTNNLLHCCLESIVNDFMELETIGKETFETTCKMIFGNDFVDETEKEIPEDARRFMEAQREFMMSDKGRGIRFNEVYNHQAFLDFMKRKRLSTNGLKMIPIDNNLIEESTQVPYVRERWFNTEDDDLYDRMYDIRYEDNPWV